jgi:hypothetical protein
MKQLLLSSAACAAIVAVALMTAVPAHADGTQFIFRGPMSKVRLVSPAAAAPSSPSRDEEATGGSGDASEDDTGDDNYAVLPDDYPASIGDTVVWTLSNGWKFTCPAEAGRKAGKLISDWPFGSHPLDWTKRGSQIVGATFEGIPNVDQIDLYFTEAGALDLVNVGAGLPWGCAPGGPDTADIPGFDLAAFEPFTATVTGVEIRHPM